MDIRLIPMGGLTLLRATSAIGQDWLDENVAYEAWQVDERGGIACDHRMANAIAEGATDEGLSVS